MSKSIIRLRLTVMGMDTSQGIPHFIYHHINRCLWLGYIINNNNHLLKIMTREPLHCKDMFPFKVVSDSPRGPVVKNLPSKAGGFTLSLGRSHMPRS